MMTIQGRIPITISPFFGFLAFFIGWINSQTLEGTLLWALVVFISVLFHEYGHALTARFFGQEASIELVALGGVTVRQGPKLKAWKEFIIILNGPLAGFLLFYLAYFLLKYNQSNTSSTWTYLLTITMYANLFWTFLNLIPVYPLDGSKLLSIFLEFLFGKKGIQISLIISMLFAIVVGLLFFLTNSIFAGSIFLLLSFESYRAWKKSTELTEKDHDTDLQAMLSEGENCLKLGQYRTAESLFLAVREKTGKGMLYQKASEQLASLYLSLQNPEKAYDLLLPLEKNLSNEILGDFQQSAFKLKHYKKAIEIGNKAHQYIPSSKIALTNALCYAYLGDAKPTLGWLQRAINDGLPNAQSILKKEEFLFLRNDPTFRNLLSRY